MTNVIPYSIVHISYPAGHMRCSNHGMCSNWNAQVATAETKNILSFRMKRALFTDLQYFFPLVKGSVRVLAAPSKARTGPQNMHPATSFEPLMCSSCLFSRC